MNFVDVLFFQAELEPEKLALVAYGSVTPYGRLIRGIISVQQRLTAIGLNEGQTIAVAVAHPIDHLVLICALYRMRITSASIANGDDVALDSVSFDAVLADKILPTVSKKQPSARIVLIDSAWFQDEVTIDLSQRGGPQNQPGDWISRITFAGAEDTMCPVKITARGLETQLRSYCLLAPPLWDRMISLAGLQSMTGLLHALSALWLGRSLCFSDPENVRNLSALYKHDYLVAPLELADPIVRSQDIDYVAIHSLSAACLECHGRSSSIVSRARSAICSHLLVRYTHPAIGIVSHGDSSRFAAVDGAVGYIAPWVEAQVINAEGVPVPSGEAGKLRFRLKFERHLNCAPGQAGESEWIYSRKRAVLHTDNLLSIHSAEL